MPLEKKKNKSFLVSRICVGTFWRNRTDGGVQAHRLLQCIRSKSFLQGCRGNDNGNNDNVILCAQTIEFTIMIIHLYPFSL